MVTFSHMGEADLQRAFLGEVGELRTLLDALARIPDAMFMIKNLESRYVYMSPALREAIYLPASFQIVGKTDFDIFPRIIAQSFRKNDLQVFETGKPLVNEVHAVGFFAHAMKWAYSSKFPLRDRTGRVIGLVTVNEEYSDVMGRDAEMNRLLPAIEYIRASYADPVTVPHLARLCSYSESQFNRVFKKYLKMTPYAFVEQVRMFHAIDALKHSGEGIASIAAACGFYDHSSFVKRFRKFTGSTPMRYRRAHGRQSQPQRAVVLESRGA